MSTPDDFESEQGDAGTAQGQKFYQVKVPNFAEQSLPNTVPSTISGAVTTVTTAQPLTGANAFLRLGTSPDPATDWSDTTFQNSVKLARLAGDPTFIAAVESLGASGGLLTSTADTPTTSFSDGTGLTSPFGATGDANFLLGFADDTRQRDTKDPTTAANYAPQTRVNNHTVANTLANRQAETLRLLTKGGWWDHSDGNRVTTTSGDKIEVIQGNYKLVVLGRQEVPTAPAATATKDDVQSAYSGLVGNAFITDVSGGHFQEQYPSPTPCIKTIEYSQDAAGEWTLYQDNGVGNLITKLKGKTVDLFQGKSREVYVGKDPKDVGASHGPDEELDPVLTARTWAQRIMTYVGSVDKPIPEIFTLTFAHAIQDIKFVTANILASTSATTVTNVTTAGIVGNLYLAPVTIELTAGFKLSLQPVLFGLNLNKTKIVGDNTTVQGGETIVSMTQSKLTAAEDSVNGSFAQIANVLMNLNGQEFEVVGDKIHVGNVDTNLSAVKFL